MERLKPCPFCGCTDVTLQVATKNAWVDCPDCGADGPFVEGDGTGAVHAWNRRADAIIHTDDSAGFIR